MELIKLHDEKSFVDFDALYFFYTQMKLAQSRNHRSPKNGSCVYIVYNPVSNLFKIGITNNFYERKSVIDTTNGIKCWTIAILFLEENYDEHPKAIETAIHEIYKSKRKEGEWFSLESWDLTEILFMFGLVNSTYGVEDSTFSDIFQTDIFQKYVEFAITEGTFCSKNCQIDALEDMSYFHPLLQQNSTVFEIYVQIIDKIDSFAKENIAPSKIFVNKYEIVKKRIKNL